MTLHAMPTGTLPFFTSDQQKLIEMVTAPDDWTPANITHDDVSLLDLLSGILKCAREVGASSPPTPPRRLGHPSP